MSKLPVLRSARNYLYKRQGPWPQPQPSHPFGMAPGVVHIPKNEMRSWFWSIGLRYVWTILSYWPKALWYAWKNPGLKPVSDAEFEVMLTHSAMSKFVSNELNEREKYPDNPKLKIFKQFLDAEPNEKFYVSDFSLIRAVKPYPGIYVASTMVLFKGALKEGKRQVVAIYFPDSVGEEKMFTPEDGEAWELAKYFALQGSSMRISLSVHANLHFPYDSINAISKSSLPKDSVLLRLLLPHFSLTLELNYAVLNSKTSPVQNPKDMPYAALPAGGKDLAGLFVEGYHGIEGNPSYPPFEYKLEVEKMYSDYGTFLDAYYNTMLSFVDKVVLQIPKEEYIDIKIWANYVKNWVPNFPSGDEIFAGEGNALAFKNEHEESVLARAIAKVIWDLSVGHAADHYDYSLININQMPFRIRIPPPFNKEHPPLDRRKMVKWTDVFKHEYERKMFFSPVNVYLLKDLVYDFNKPNEQALRELNVEFMKDLKEIEPNLKVHNYIPLDMISRSIQY